jgi:hypothetical protein
MIHMRRGDISPCSIYANCFLPNSYYLEIIRDLLPPGLNVMIRSELECMEPFDGFVNYILWIDSDLPSAWHVMLTADFVVLLKSISPLSPQCSILPEPCCTPPSFSPRYWDG